MTVPAFLIATLFLGCARAAVVELSCSDNATCIENLANEFVRNVRQQKTVRLFDILTVEPLKTRQARSNEGLLPRILNNNAFSFDFNDYTFRIWKAQNRNDALDFEVFESRSAKDVSEEVPKKSKSKVEEEEEEDKDVKKTPKPKGGIIKRRAKKKIMQAVIPMLFGMKSAAVVIFAMAIVTVLTLKAFVASKMALIVTVGMAIKRLYESYSLGVGLQNHPYLYSQYPIDFPSASSHAYSVSGMSPQFPEMYNPTAMGTHQTELLPQQDSSAQQSQQAPTVQLLNSTRASERWDGKSLLQKLIEPIVEGIKTYIDPITNMFSIPATFRGLNSDVTTTTTVEEEEVKKPREILVPQPRYIAQRKMNYRKAVYRSRPKKYTELKVDLDKLKKNKDLYEYVKTKKYKHNYQNTYYYPRVKYFVNPNVFIVKPKNNRLVPYKKEIHNVSFVNKINTTAIPFDYWKPVVLFPVLNQNTSNINKTNIVTEKLPQFVNKRQIRVKRSLDLEPENINKTKNLDHFFGYSLSGRGVMDFLKKIADEDYLTGITEYAKSAIENWSNSTNFGFDLSGRGFMDFMQKLSDEDPVTGIMEYANKYTKSAIKHSLKSTNAPHYYTITYELVMMTLDVIDGLVQVHQALMDYVLEDLPKKKLHTHQHQHVHNHSQKKKKRKKKPSHQSHHSQQNLQQQSELDIFSQNQLQEGSSKVKKIMS